MTKCFLKAKIRHLEVEIMNARQAAKAASLRVMELERLLALNKGDIVNYNLCILHMIDGGSPCGFCEDEMECQLEAKGGKGCGDWMLKMQKFTQGDVNEEGDNEVHTSGLQESAD